MKAFQWHSPVLLSTRPTCHW